MSRRPSIDWLRGVAVLFMILWHSIDAWTIPTGRDNGAFTIITFIAGWAAPLFLFLAGVSVPLAGATRMARGFTRRAASWSIQKRGWEVFLLAHLFRFQSFVFNPYAEWNSLLKPDILNVLGLAIVAAAYGWGRAGSLNAAAAWLLMPAAISVGLIAPWAPHWAWPSMLTPRLEAYIRPMGDSGVFSMFPSAGYVFVGAFLGVLLSHRDDRDVSFHLRIGFAGACALLLGACGTYVPWALSRNAWVSEVSACVFRTGAMTLALAASWALLRWRPPTSSNAVITLGRASLIVYWVHVELSYGIFSYPLHHALTLPWALVACALLTASMLGLAILWLRRPVGRPLIPPHMVATA